MIILKWVLIKVCNWVWLELSDVQGAQFGKFHKYDNLFLRNTLYLAACRNHYAYSVHLDD